MARYKRIESTPISRGEIAPPRELSRNEKAKLENLFKEFHLGRFSIKDAGELGITGEEIHDWADNNYLDTLAPFPGDIPKKLEDRKIFVVKKNGSTEFNEK